MMSYTTAPQMPPQQERIEQKADKLTESIFEVLKSHYPHYEPTSLCTFSEVRLLISNALEEMK